MTTDLRLVKQETIEQTINRIFNTPDIKHKVKRAVFAVERGHKQTHNVAIGWVAGVRDLPPKLVKDIVENPRTKTIYDIITKELQWAGEIV